MATVEPFLGTRYNPEHVKLGGVLRAAIRRDQR